MIGQYKVVRPLGVCGEMADQLACLRSSHFSLRSPASAATSENKSRAPICDRKIPCRQEHSFCLLSATRGNIVRSVPTLHTQGCACSDTAKHAESRHTGQQVRKDLLGRHFAICTHVPRVLPPPSAFQAHPGRCCIPGGPCCAHRARKLRHQTTLSEPNLLPTCSEGVRAVQLVDEATSHPQSTSPTLPLLPGPLPPLRPSLFVLPHTCSES